MSKRMVYLVLTLEEATALNGVVKAGWGDGDYEEAAGRKTGALVRRASEKLTAARLAAAMAKAPAEFTLKELEALEAELAHSLEAMASALPDERTKEFQGRRNALNRIWRKLVARLGIMGKEG